ncbi:MAG: hypothetical protein MUC65_06920 [Pontiellaceae bacterium]|jgi:hypothetical protein|nr:hypothetical protein [Pontiellaceae bacterium]
MLAASAVCCGVSAGSFNPFYENLETNSESFFAVRPFYSHTVTEEREFRDVFWPLYSSKEFKDEESSRALIFWYTRTFNVQDETPRERNWLLPICFQGRDAAGKGYFAIFPLGGTIHEFLGRDEIRFALFPIYGESRINDLETTSVFWPVYSRTRGEGVQRDRLFPIVGKSVRENRYEKRFLFWPFWTSADYFYPGNSGHAWMLFPLCGRANMEHEKTFWLIPPFFRFTAGEKQNKLYCPWPFIQRIDGNRQDKFYVWPLWGKKQYAGGLKHRTFLLWPIFWSEKAQESDRIKTRRMAMPFFTFERTVLPDPLKTEPVELSNYWRIWPLMSWQNEGDTSRFRMLEIWPVKGSAPVERNWAPLWTLYKRTGREGVVEKDLLWFAWHSESEPEVERKEWSLLKGLMSYRREGDARSMRLLYFIHFGKEE